MKTILILTLLFASSLTLARFSGAWKGTGTLTHSTGGKEECSLSITIEHTPQTFLVQESLFDCKTMKIRNKGQQPLNILKGQLWWNQLLLGTISDTVVKTQMKSSDGRSFAYHLELQSQSEMFYQDEIEWVKGYRTNIEGLLMKIPQSFQY